MEFVQSSGSARRRLALHALETKQKEKGNKHQSTGSRRAAVRIRAAPPFFWWKGWGAWKGGAREGSYLSLNCRWRLRLFKKKSQSSQKKSRQEKKSKIAKKHLTWSGQRCQQKIGKTEQGVREWSRHRYRDKAQG